MSIIGHNKKGRTVNSLSADERAKLKKFVEEIDDSLTKIAAERELIKDILDRAKDELSLSPSLVRKLGKIHHKATFKEEVDEHDTVVEFYEIVMIGPESIPPKN
jgi:uncharacterized FlgJ-related protein